jgi:hypothetical protein
VTHGPASDPERGLCPTHPCLLARPLSLSFFAAFKSPLAAPQILLTSPALPGSRHKLAPIAPATSRVSRTSCSTPRQSRLSALAPDRTFRWTCNCFGIYSPPLHMISLLFFRPSSWTLWRALLTGGTQTKEETKRNGPRFPGNTSKQILRGGSEKWGEKGRRSRKGVPCRRQTARRRMQMSCVQIESGK